MTGTITRVTIREVADAAGVSRQTVSNALVHPERVKEPTLEKVRRVIDELGIKKAVLVGHSAIGPQRPPRRCGRSAPAPWVSSSTPPVPRPRML